MNQLSDYIAGEQLRAAGRPELARLYYQQMVRQCRAVEIDSHANNFNLAEVLVGDGKCCVDMGAFQEAEEVFTEALETLQFYNQTNRAHYTPPQKEKVGNLFLEIHYHMAMAHIYKPFPDNMAADRAAHESIIALETLTNPCINPEPVYMQAGLIREKLGDLCAAEQHYEKARVISIKVRKGPTG